MPTTKPIVDQLISISMMQIDVVCSTHVHIDALILRRGHIRGGYLPANPRSRPAAGGAQASPGAIHHPGSARRCVTADSERNLTRSSCARQDEPSKAGPRT